MYISYLTVDEENFPHGLRCGYCHRVIDNGKPYVERFDGFTDTVPVVMLTCVYC